MKKVLIIEDDERVAKALDIRIRHAGYETNIVPDALNAVIAASKFAPDALLVDIHVPAGGGFNAAERIQINAKTRIPTIFITASKKPGLMDRAIEAGASGFLEKPYQAESLLQLLANVLDKPTPPRTVPPPRR